jgi:lipopolysaccharide transport system permease protein
MQFLEVGFVDLARSLKSWRLWSLLGWLEIRQRYARSKVGPFWLTISTGVLIGTMGVVYGTLLGQKLKDYLPMLAIGIVLWNFFSSSVNEGSLVYISSANYIRQVKTARFVWVLQMIWRNIVIFVHNLVIILLVDLLFGVKDWFALLLFIPGFFIFVANAAWIAAALGPVSARFRDLPQIVAAVLQVAFYITPILFSSTMLHGRAHWIVDLNPLAYLIELARQPLLGEVPSARAWLIGTGMAVIGWIAALWVTGRLHRRIPYWI